MAGSIYVSDPVIWRKFYKNMLNGKFRPEQYRPNQTGGSGVAGMYADSLYKIPVNPNTDEEEKEKIIVGKQITPMAAEVERAKSELKEAIRKDRPHVPINKKKSTKSEVMDIGHETRDSMLCDEKNDSLQSLRSWDLRFGKHMNQFKTVGLFRSHCCVD
ncbi:hypothetical protein KUTeg_001722 [Tegillarca granosa]|uniref:Uncharacterized protein n=1 Tax=Tegillarca granosa TaxID=220873 RepID=A0ABQ9FSC9_TEGGR|nr:hypothetical protein KUTeg_001722 [Tegillarca granosa]